MTDVAMTADKTRSLPRIKTSVIVMTLYLVFLL